MAPRAASPARRSASVSPCGRPPGWVQPRPTTRPSRTMTQPTAGLGQTSPRPRRAKAIAMRIWAMSFIELTACGSIVVGADPADEFAEILGLAEIAIDRGETHISDLV